MPSLPLIFTLLLEPLAQKTHNNDNISGIPIAGHEHKITLFADDIILTLMEPASSLPAVCDILEMFNSCSYYKVNDSKSNVLNARVQDQTSPAIQNPL